MRKIGINLLALPGMTDADYLRAAAELGFEAIFTGMMEESKQLECADLMARNGLEYETIHAPFHGINSIWLEGSDGETMLAKLTGCVGRCAQVGAGIAVVHLSSGNTPPSITDIGRVRFARLVEYAAQKNVKLAFENQRKLANLAWAMESFGDTVGFCWDCGHESCFTPGREYMPLFGDRLICTHIHDNEGIFDKDDHWIPFDGNINFERFAQHISKANYTGSLMLELAYNRPRYADMSAETYLRCAVEAAKRLAQMVGE